MALEVLGDKILNWCKYEGILLLIIENESKSHTQMLVTLMQHGVEIYPGSGKSLGIERKMTTRLEAMIVCLTRRNLRRLTKKLKHILNGKSKIEIKADYDDVEEHSRPHLINVTY